MRVLVCGSREWIDREFMRAEMAKHPISVVIQGEARGADLMAKELSKEMGVPCECYPADWERHGRAAGPIRNRQMLVSGNPDLVLAFHDDLEQSRGTKDMVTQARRAGVEVTVCGHGPTEG